MPFRRMGRPGLVGMAARTAVVAGTATAVSGNVQRRQAGRQQDAYEQQQYEAQQQQAQMNAAAKQAVAQQQAAMGYAAQPPAPAAPAGTDLVGERAGSHDAGCRTVGEERRRHDRVGVVRRAQVQRAEFGRDDEHDRGGIRLAELLRRAQGRHRGVAAHEAEVVALHRGAEPQLAYEHEVGAGRVEPGARHGDDMGDVGCLDAGASVDRRLRGLHVELGRLRRVDLVARLRPGEEQLVAIEVEEHGLLGVRVPTELLEHGVPRLDARHVERGRDDPLRQPIQPRLGSEHVANLLLHEHRRRHRRRDRAQ